MSKIKLTETATSKHLRSENYNYNFDKKSGFFARWGKTKEDDPQVGLPEIADIEITTKCNGIRGKLCPMCYKGNTPNGDNMSVETYKKILDKMHYTMITIELEDGNYIVLHENDCVNTQRGTMKAKDLLCTDEII